MSIFLPLIEILFIACMLNYLVSFFWKTKSMDLALGFVAFFLVLGVSSWINLPVLHKILLFAGNLAPLAVVILFQAELRTALSKLSWKGSRYQEMTAFDKFLDQFTSSVYRMSEKQIGALIAIEKNDSLEEFVQKAVLLHAQFSSELLETIFVSRTPLHDGGVIMRNQTILAAASIFPLAEDSAELGRATMGTRHRAALGLSQTVDALIVVVSEETGKVSIAREGVMTRGIRSDRFKAILRTIFATPVPVKRRWFS